VVWNLGPKRVSIFFHLWIFLKELLWFGISKIKIKIKIKNLILLNNLPNWNFQNVKEFANLVFLNCLGFVYFKELKSKIEFWL